MLISDTAFLASAMKKQAGERVFYQIPIVLLTTASIAYFCMASDLGGGTPSFVEFVRRGFSSSPLPTRSILVRASVYICAISSMVCQSSGG